MLSFRQRRNLADVDTYTRASDRYDGATLDVRLLTAYGVLLAERPIVPFILAAGWVLLALVSLIARARDRRNFSG